ncbi:MAG: molecular chaperone DnaK [Candidatus Bathyarchaeota archaeon]|nr:molecular chaperone DnaK [Candidatus Bathyarchaeota archaeon]
MGRTLGIDLGTTNSAGAVMKDGKIRLVPASEGPTLYGKMFPSIVAFKEDGEIIVGKNAKAYAYVHPDRTIRWIKRRMGTDYTVDIDGCKYTPQEISALILKKIKKDAETYLGEKIDKAVISAPAYFNNNQRNATKEAGEKAGLEVLRIVSEPTAASLAYGLDKVRKNLKIAVLDLGAGTFDVTILQMNSGIFKVISTSGDTRLGGKDMDDTVLDYLVDRIEEKNGMDLRDDKKNLNKLRDAGEMAKIHLSSKSSTTIMTQLNIDGSSLNPHVVLTREKLEELIKPELDRLRDPLEQALKDAELEPQDIDKLVFVGGPTRMPVIRRYFKDFFSGLEPEEGIDPMGIVASGASIQASILKGEIRDMLLLDVTPLSLGVETSGGVFARLIKRNTTIPTEESMTFATEEDDQTSMMIHVLQGEREMAADNTSLGLFKLDGIPPAPRYEQEVEVTFNIDADGILSVSAEILETGKKEAIKVTKPTKLSEDEITRLIIEATKFDEMDERKKEMIEARNRAEAVIYATEKSIEEIRRKISERERRKLEKTLEKLKTALNNGKAQKTKEYTDELLELVKGVTMKVKKVSQAKKLASFAVEKKLKDKLSTEEKRKVEEAVKRLETAPYKDVKREMDKLKEMIALLEREHGET